MWLSVEEDIPQILVETLDSANPAFYPGIYVAIKTLLTYPVSTCASERITDHQHEEAKAPLRSVVSDARLSSLSVIHVHKHKEIGFKKVISDFARQKAKTSSVFVKGNHYNFYESSPQLNYCKALDLRFIVEDPDVQTDCFVCICKKCARKGNRN